MTIITWLFCLPKPFYIIVFESIRWNRSSQHTFARHWYNEWHIHLQTFGNRNISEKANWLSTFQFSKTNGNADFSKHCQIEPASNDDLPIFKDFLFRKAGVVCLYSFVDVPKLHFKYFFINYTGALSIYFMTGLNSNNVLSFLARFSKYHFEISNPNLSSEWFSMFPKAHFSTIWQCFYHVNFGFPFVSFW